MTSPALEITPRPLATSSYLNAEPRPAPEVFLRRSVNNHVMDAIEEHHERVRRELKQSTSLSQEQAAAATREALSAFADIINEIYGVKP